MRKMSMFAAVVLLACVVTTASAGTINMFFSTGDTNGRIEPLSGLLYPFPVTGNATLYVAPNSSAPQAAFSSASMFLYMDNGCQGGGVGDEGISSSGLDVIANLTSAVSSPVTATAFDIHNTAALTGAANAPWSGVNTPTLAAAPALVTNSRAVLVPASTAATEWDAYSPTQPGAGPCAGGTYTVNWLNAAGFNHYQLGKMTVSAGALAGCDPFAQIDCQAKFDVFMKVGTLKITRVYDPTAPQGPTPEAVSFGYNLAGAAPDATVPGNVAGGQSPVADGTIVVRKKGDVGGLDANFVWQFGIPDGEVDISDALYIYDNQAAITAGGGASLWSSDVGGLDDTFTWQFGAGFVDGVCDISDALYIYDNMQGS